jgi:AAA+ ATPase superfamily predicted ATPase
MVEGILDEGVIRGDYSAYLGMVFEDVCRQFLLRNAPGSFTKIGRWWHEGTEIDIIGLDEKKSEILFAECKWKDNVNPETVLRLLMEKSKRVAWRSGRRKERYCIIAKSFTKKIDGCTLFNLNDIRKSMRA